MAALRAVHQPGVAVLAQQVALGALVDGGLVGGVQADGALQHREQVADAAIVGLEKVSFMEMS